MTLFFYIVLENVLILFFYFYWSVVDLECCVNFAVQKSDSDIYILFHYGLSQDIQYSSLCYTVGPCCLSILYIIVCYHICYYSLLSANPKLQIHHSPTFPPPWQPQVCSLCLWVCFSFIDKFICVIFYIKHISGIIWYLSFSFLTDFIYYDNL